jgi:HNH endonuclease
VTHLPETLERIFAKTDGRCHLCHKQLSWCNYGACGTRGAWEVDHSVPRAPGGTDHGNNLFAACMSCNRSKQHGSTRTHRRSNGVRRAPLSRQTRIEARNANMLGVGSIGVCLGGLIGGPPLALLCGLLGAAVGWDADPEQS